MKTLILGVRHQAGIAKESGRPYEMRPQLIVGSVLEAVERENLRIKAVGYDSMFLECDPLVFNELLRLPLNKFPLVVDLDVTTTKRGDSAVPYVAAMRQAA